MQSPASKQSGSTRGTYSVGNLEGSVRWCMHRGMRKEEFTMFCRTAVVVLGLSFSVGFSQAAEPEIWELWPGTPPGDVGNIGAEHDTTTPDGRMVAGRRVTRLTNVSKPLLSIYRPAPELDTGTAVIIAPGGGHRILAYDLEGTEVADWLNSIGVTGVLLKYRVPFRDPDKRWLAAAQDGQRAVSVVRARAGEIGVDPNKIGVLGFSAGGTPVRYSALVSERLYEPVDEYDNAPFRPDFAAPIYSAGCRKAGRLRRTVHRSSWSSHTMTKSAR